MSYILDALRKADAQRERDPSRGIHAQPLATAAQPAAGAARPWFWLAAGVLLAALGAYGLRAFAPAPEAPVARPAARGVTVPAAAGLVPAAVVPVTVANAVHPPAPPAPLVAGVPAGAAKARPTEAAAPAAGQEGGLASAASRAAPASTAATGAGSGNAAAAPAAADRVFAVSELPAELQRELPKLAISGGVHSDDAAQRMLIVGGEVVREGAEVAPGVTLEQIRPRAAVLKFRGYRYTLVY